MFNFNQLQQIKNGFVVKIEIKFVFPFIVLISNELHLLSGIFQQIKGH